MPSMNTQAHTAVLTKSEQRSTRNCAGFASFAKHQVCIFLSFWKESAWRGTLDRILIAETFVMKLTNREPRLSGTCCSSPFTTHTENTSHHT